ncbi:hypothetical protein [Kitasatospora sp. NPDC086791]|uniref:hypothetical protein n=1 Tax=Kitasatospora sp. NPDC086791 TaxID=3155178 RepID=UPI00344152E2
MTTAWPFGDDADRNDLLTAHRIAVASPHARWNYILTFDHESEARPTHTETLILASFLAEYIDHWYDTLWKKRLAERPLDVDGGANGYTFHKYGDGDWGYRQRSWRRGPMFVPVRPSFRGHEYDDTNGLGPLTLVQVMDRIHTISKRPMQHWLDWKAAHPEVFAQ